MGGLSQGISLALLPLVVAIAGAQADAAELHKGPYLVYGDSNTEMVVLWQADGTADGSTIELGTTPSLGDGPHTVSAYGDDQYAFTATGLEPGALYHYRVIVDDEVSEGTFRAAPADDATQTTLYVYGDSRSGPRRQRDVHRQILADMDASPQQRQTVCLHTGDWVFAGMAEGHWRRQHFNRSMTDTLRFHREVPLMGARGNHELNGGLLRKYYPYPTPAEDVSYYSFDHGPVHIVIIDDMADTRAGSAQYDWIRDDLHNSTKPWKVAVLHQPAWGAGRPHANDRANQLLTTDLLQPSGVDLVLAGHNHHYARNSHDDVVHLTTGGGGAPLYGAKRRPGNADVVVNALHFIRFDVDGLEIQTTAIDVDGNVIDQFVITHGAAGRAGAVARTISSPATPATEPSSAKRPVPDYDGRGESKPTPADNLLWIPRSILAPVYWTGELVLHRPLGELVTEVERHRVPAKLMYLAKNRPAGIPGLFPTTLVEFRFRPSVGLYFFWDHFPVRIGRFRIHAAFGGRGWYRVKVKQRFFVRPARQEEVPPWDRSQITLQFTYRQQPDHMFFGLGTLAGDTVTRVARRRIGGGVSAEIFVGHLDRMEIGVELEDNTFGPGYRRKDSAEPSIDEVFDVTDEEQVPGFEGYLLGQLSAGLRLDTRRASPPVGSGVQLDVQGDLGGDVRGAERWFVRWGGQVGVFLDPGGHNRVFHISQDVWLVHPLQGAVPFAEQITLGGSGLMRGFPRGRYHGLSAWVTTLEYVYPIWIFLDGFVFAEVGNVFGLNFEGFGFERMSLSLGMGIRTKAIRDITFDLLIGLGSSRFDDPPFRADQVRLTVGLNKGF